tara:strand:- start:76 stop:363 length:288 start_codon:yes stop_codon:yes gene_type:complete
MKINKQDLKNISLLSKIKIDEDNSASLITDLESILNMVNKMEKIDTSSVEELSHPITTTQTLREDELKDEIDREKLQKLTKEKSSGFYLTPKVIE